MIGRHNKSGLVGCGAVLALGVGLAPATAAATPPESSAAQSAIHLVEGPAVNSAKLPVDIATGDLNEDGSTDIVSSDDWQDVLAISLGRGGGRFPQRPVVVDPIPATPFVGQIAITDADGDGHLDVVMSPRYSFSTIGPQTVALLGDGTGAFPRSVFSVGVTDAADLEVADVDSDGDPDLVATGFSNTTPGFVTVLMNDGSGAFVGTTYQPEAAPRDTAIGDVTADGIADLVVAGAAGITTLIGDGAGGYTAGPGAGVGALTDLSLGDVDRDGALDVVAVQRGVPVGTSPTSDVLVLRGDGRGRFAPASTRPGGQGDARTRLVDLDADGYLDLVITAAVRNTRTGSSLLVLPGVGSPELGSPQTYTLLINPTEAAIADLDGNGTMDIAVGVGKGARAHELGAETQLFFQR